MAKSTETKKVEYEKEDAYRTLEITNSWISNIDTKASFLLAYIAVLLGFVISNGKPAVFDASVKITTTVIVQRVSHIFLYLSSVLCITFLFLTLKARIKDKNATKPSLMFFGTISSHSLSDYISKTVNRSENIQVKDILEQVYTNSAICNKKACMYNVAVVFSIISTFLLFACFIFELL